jgi:hypothetical protein
MIDDKVWICLESDLPLAGTVLEAIIELQSQGVRLCWMSSRLRLGLVSSKGALFVLETLHRAGYYSAHLTREALVDPTSVVPPFDGGRDVRSCPSFACAHAKANVYATALTLSTEEKASRRAVCFLGCKHPYCQMIAPQDALRVIATREGYIINAPSRDAADREHPAIIPLDLLRHHLTRFL